MGSPGRAEKPQDRAASRSSRRCGEVRARRRRRAVARFWGVCARCPRGNILGRPLAPPCGIVVSSAASAALRTLARQGCGNAGIVATDTSLHQRLRMAYMIFVKCQSCGTVGKIKKYKRGPVFACPRCRSTINATDALIQSSVELLAAADSSRNPDGKIALSQDAVRRIRGFYEDYKNYGLPYREQKLVVAVHAWYKALRDRAKAETFRRMKMGEESIRFVAPDADKTDDDLFEAVKKALNGVMTLPS